jgi:hypothetical protein
MSPVLHTALLDGSFAIFKQERSPLEHTDSWKSQGSGFIHRLANGIHDLIIANYIGNVENAVHPALNRVINAP